VRDVQTSGMTWMTALSHYRSIQWMLVKLAVV